MKKEVRVHCPVNVLGIQFLMQCVLLRFVHGAFFQPHLATSVHTTDRRGKLRTRHPMP